MYIIVTDRSADFRRFFWPPNVCDNISEMQIRNVSCLSWLVSEKSEVVRLASTSTVIDDCYLKDK